MLKVRVRCEFEVTVEYPDEMRDSLKFLIEENSCPGTHAVGTVVNPIIERSLENSVCWACNLKATNKIVSVETV